MSREFPGFEEGPMPYSDFSPKKVKEDLQIKILCRQYGKSAVGGFSRNPLLSKMSFGSLPLNVLWL